MAPENLYFLPTREGIEPCTLKQVKAEAEIMACAMRALAGFDVPEPETPMPSPHAAALSFISALNTCFFNEAGKLSKVNPPKASIERLYRAACVLAAVGPVDQNDQEGGAA
jgi:hypothetical protein